MVGPRCLIGFGDGGDQAISGYSRAAHRYPTVRKSAFFNSYLRDELPQIIVVDAHRLDPVATGWHEVGGDR